MNVHPGLNAMISKISENYYWPKMADSVNEVIRLCNTCITQKPDRRKPAGNMFHFQIFSPGEQVAIDLIEDLIESHNGNSFIIVAIDIFTRFVEAKAVPDKGAPTFLEFLISYCGRYGVPKTFLTDNSTTFINELDEQVMNTFNATHVKATPYHSQSTAIVERVNQRIEEKMRVLFSCGTASHN